VQILWFNFGVGLCDVIYCFKTVGDSNFKNTIEERNSRTQITSAYNPLTYLLTNLKLEQSFFTRCTSSTRLHGAKLIRSSIAQLNRRSAADGIKRFAFGSMRSANSANEQMDWLWGRSLQLSVARQTVAPVDRSAIHHSDSACGARPVRLEMTDYKWRHLMTSNDPGLFVIA